jgi:uncharacterized membrane protein
MMLLALGIIVFLGIHLLPTQPDLRSGLVTRFGAGAYKAAFALLSFAGLALIVLGYHKLQLMPGKNPQIWVPPTGMRHLAAALMLPALILLAAAYIPSRIRTAVKHPMLAAVKIWALAHLLANGDLAGIVLFGSFLAWAVVDRISVKKRGALGPLGAAKGGLGGDLAAVLAGAVFYVVLILGGHYWLFGKVPLPIAFSFAP